MVAENIYHRGHIYDSPESLQLAVYLPNKKCANLIFLYLDKTNHNSVFPNSCSHVIPLYSNSFLFYTNVYEGCLIFNICIVQYLKRIPLKYCSKMNISSF